MYMARPPIDAGCSISAVVQFKTTKPVDTLGRGLVLKHTPLPVSHSEHWAEPKRRFVNGQAFEYFKRRSTCVQQARKYKSHWQPSLAWVRSVHMQEAMQRSALGQAGHTHTDSGSGAKIDQTKRLR